MGVMNTKSLQTNPNLSDSGATVHRKPHHSDKWHSEWCGYYDLEDRPIYLPRLTERQIREIAESATVLFRKSNGLSLFCTGFDHHLCGERGGPTDCRIIDRFGIPRVTCRLSGCEEQVWKINEYMAMKVISDVLQSQSNGSDEEEETR
jgi:hypothetical protein